MSTNPAALQGWVKSTDPKTGRAFYANHITRKTQWDPPEGWMEPTVVFSAPPAFGDDDNFHYGHNGSSSSNNNNNHNNNSNDDNDNEPLPSNWEVMHDPTTGKPFYVDHERKITTWTRPKPEKKMSAVSLQPAKAATNASPSSGNNSSAALARILAAQQQQASLTRSYSTEASYYATPKPQEVDLSDALPPLEFSVKKVADALRPTCPHCDVLFTLSKRRHHCRLCGDVFCDACSNHRVNLPLEGPEFEKPVRVCDYCFEDVDQGNFFSLRRYLTPLHLYNHKDFEEEQEGGVATAANVNAALSALTQDLEQMLNNPSDEKRMTIPPHIMIPEIVKHMAHQSTSNRAIRAIAALLALETLTSTTDFSTALYLYGKGSNGSPTTGTKVNSTSSAASLKSSARNAVEISSGNHTALDHILQALERSGSDRKTLYVQEQAAKTLFYLTEPKTITAAARKHAELQSGSFLEEDGIAVGDHGSVEDLDLKRAVRSLLDHSSASKNPNLQRWSAAGLQNLINEDQRRACLAANDVAALVASGESGSNKLEYESFLPDLLSTGGIMILCSLIGTDDADTRAHAVGALAATLRSTRAVQASMTALRELSGGSIRVKAPMADGDIVRAIVAGGGCGSSVSQLLLSADDAVAGMGCQFLSSLVMPILTFSATAADGDGGGDSSIGSHYDARNDSSAAGACREASIEIATDSCLPALLSLVRENGGRNRRPTELKKMGMETLAAIVLSVGEMGRSWANGAYEEGLERAGAPAKLKDAIVLLNEEGTMDVVLEILLSGSGQSLGGSSRETPASRIREAAGIILGSLTSCSAEAIIELQSKQQILSPLISAMNDSSMTIASTLRGDAAPRCSGVLETVSAIVMFAWQHPSGAQSELLDRLIELIDAGAIPYLSKVINLNVEWDSGKSIGTMKAKAAGCRLLCCLFGIALTDDTGIGTRRLMDAIASDARGYRGGERMPSDIIEATLGVLQSSSNHARRALMGSTNMGQSFQSALMDLVDSALLAAGSMCGSSVAPGGSEGIMVTGENFLVAREDQYVGKRKDICRIACEVVVRAGRSGPSLLPTMLVGGFGECTVLSSLRLALAVAQNGSKDEHAKLAMSGLLVPVSDSLRAALAKGDLYRFSASLALVRFCGPHLAAGQGGGIESVRSAIRVATNVLTLPINPDASIEQMETQESLKSECIAALESLSRNASLWSSISTEALPAIVQYLHSTATLKSASAQHQKTRTAALRAVMQIVQVPSHAVAAAESGIVEPLGKLLRTGDVSCQDNEVPMLALEILHVLCNNRDAQRRARFLDTGLARSICAAIGKSATEKANKPTDSRADVTFLGLEILHSILANIENNLETHMILQSREAIAFLDAIASEPSFVRSMCSTLLLRTNMKLPRHDSDQSGEAVFDIPKLYGPPLIHVAEKCAGYDGTHDAAAAILFTASVYACAIESQRSEAFWKTVQLQDDSSDADAMRVSATFCAHYLSLLTLDFKPFVPTDHVRYQDYVTITRPLVRYRLLEALRDTLDDLSNQSAYGNDPYVISLLVGFNVPHICLSLWKDPAILDLAFELIKKIVEQEPDEVLHLFVEGKAAITSLFDLLNVDSSFESSSNVPEIRRFLASVLGQLGESGLLASAVEKYDVRSSAIAALAAACLNEEERPNEEDDEDMTSHRLSAALMKCLVELCTVKNNGSVASKRIQLSSLEAEALAKNLGKKICHMVLSRFLERAKLQQYEIEEDEDIMEAPDVSMLCAIAQHDGALAELRVIGGLHALSLVAAEGELSAIEALKKACGGDGSVLLEGDTYLALMNLVVDDRRHGPAYRQLEAAAFELLERLCSWSSKGRKAVAESPSCQDCVRQAIHVIRALSDKGDKTDDSTSDEEDEKSADEAAPTGLELPPPPDYSLLVAPAGPQGKEFELEVAACAFLSVMVLTSIGRAEIIGDSYCIDTLSTLASKGENDELMYAALKVLNNLAVYTTDEGPLSADQLACVILSVLTSDKKIVSTPSLNANMMFDSCTVGLEIIFDCLSDERAKSLALAVSSLFMKGVKNCTITRSTTRETERAFAAELCYDLSTVLVLARGKSFVDEVFTQELLTSFCHLFQWRHDPKTSLGNTSAQHWDGSIANCLLILCAVIHRPDVVLNEAGVELKALSQTVLMLARPGKAPRRAIDLKAALQLLSESKDASVSILASRIVTRLFD